jgi:hypothetical protein
MDYIAEALRITNQKRIADGLPPLKHFGAGEDGHHHDYIEPVRVRKVCPPAPLESVPPPQNSTCPAEIRIWPQLILCAAQQNLGGAVRLWSFARALDQSSGSGIIAKAPLFDYLKWLGVPSANRYRWLQSAIQNNFLRPVRNGSAYMISSVQQVGLLLNSDDIGNRCIILAKTLVRTHWKSSVWDLVLTQFKNRPVSRATLQQITSVPARTQVELERYGLVQSQRNWCVAQTSPGLITPYREFSRPHAFIAKIVRQNFVVYQLPNNYTVPRLSGSTDGGGYRRKAYAAASASAKSDNREIGFPVVRFPENPFRDGGTRCEKIVRLYYDRQKPFVRALRRLGRAGINGTLYQKTTTATRKKSSGWYLEEEI